MQKLVTILVALLVLSGLGFAQGSNQVQTKSLTMKVVSQLTITTTTLPAGVTGQTYSATIAALGGVSPYTWSGTGLPTWLTVNATTGILSGTIPQSACPPGPVCPFTFSITVTDSTSQISQVLVDGQVIASRGVLIFDQPLFDGLP